MAEFTRSIVARLRQFVGDRRRSSRRSVRLRLSLSLISPSKNRNGKQRISSLDGYTLDLGLGGLGIVVPRITLDEHHLVGENRILNVKLELPTGPVEMRVLPVRYESLEEHETETGYLIGVRIEGMSDEDRMKFTDYFASLASG
ncbi:MAG: hypothetical protein QOJ88_372 [Pyrinomonadaceae bacterium]|jgi:hypothetical protein|nr:hypothetical protein [Pyrinomonadaceae bacterium]